MNAPVTSTVLTRAACAALNCAAERQADIGRHVVVIHHLTGEVAVRDYMLDTVLAARADRLESDACMRDALALAEVGQ